MTSIGKVGRGLPHNRNELLRFQEKGAMCEG